MSIGTITQDLVDRVKGVTEFSSRVGLAVGGQEFDPTNQNLTRPAAWVVYVGDSIETQNTMNPCQPLIRYNFVVKVLVDYDNEANLISTHLPLLHSVVRAVQGGEPVPGGKWSYDGQGLESLDPERMVWAQQYSILNGVG